VKAGKRSAERRAQTKLVDKPSCSTGSGLGHEQCAACAGQSAPQRKVCEEKVKDLYCQGRAGPDPACPEGERAQVFPANSQY
jgi:hypothetical protein